MLASWWLIAYTLTLKMEAVWSFETSEVRLADVITSNPSYLLIIHVVAKGNDIFYLVSWGVVRLSPLGTAATNWPIVPAPDDRR
jgi:hypothetical protein